MIEGVVVGLFGAVIAVGILLLGKVTIVDPLADDFALVDNLDTIGFAPLVADCSSARWWSSALGSGSHAAPLPPQFETAAGRSPLGSAVGDRPDRRAAVAVARGDFVGRRPRRLERRAGGAGRATVIEDHYFHGRPTRRAP